MFFFTAFSILYTHILVYGYDLLSLYIFLSDPQAYHSTKVALLYPHETGQITLQKIYYAGIYLVIHKMTQHELFTFHNLKYCECSHANKLTKRLKHSSATSIF